MNSSSQIVKICRNVLRCRLQVDRTADYPAAQQVFASLLVSASSAGRQKSVRFCSGIGVFFTPEDFANPIGVSSEFVNDICVCHALHAKDVNCYSLGKSERSALFRDSIQNHTCHWVSFVIGVIPKKIWHDGTSMVARWVNGGVSGISPSTQISRALLERAVNSVGAVIRGHRSNADPQYRSGRSRQTSKVICLATFGGSFVFFLFLNVRKSAFECLAVLYQLSPQCEVSL